MKKFIWISLLIFFVLGCGSRKREMNKGSEKTNFESTTSGKNSTDFTKTTFKETDLSELFENQNIKILSNGSPYKLQYGSVIFSGSADIELSSNKKETKSKSKVYDHYKLITTTQYFTNTKYQTHTNYKTVITERSGLSILSYIGLGFLVFYVIVIIYRLGKAYLQGNFAGWISKIFKRK